MTRANSRAGPITCMVEEYYQERLANVIPALGTHVPMPDWQLDKMFPTVPKSKVVEHDWRNDVVTIGEVPREYVSEVTGGVYEECGLTSPVWKCQLNRLLWEGDHDLILSIGQVVPHEVIGMANYTKNVFVGTGGKDGINESHFIGAAYGMEKMMGRADTPVRRIMNSAYDRFALCLPLLFILTVMGKDDEKGGLVMRGLYIGDDHNCFEEAAKLSLKCNFVLVDEQPKKVVVYLDPEEFHTTWLGNKAVYRTRMLIADEGELVILAPAVAGFGEDDAIDGLIRKYGYRTTPEVLRFVKENEDIGQNLSAAAHLIHGLSEGRFKVTYCTPKLSREEVEGVGFAYGDFDEHSKKYNHEELKDGWNDVDGERLWYVSNPALGLWAWKGRFEDLA